jgi:class 3 adenylate cyclase
MKENQISGEARTTMRHLLHDVRTPLGQIMGYSEMLQEEAQDRGQQDLVPDLKKIENAARHLLRYVEDLFRPGAGAPASAAGMATEVSAARPTEGAGEVASVAARPVAPASGSLLVVDDEPLNRDLLVRRLERVGYRVTAAEDGPSALRAIGESEYDLVLLDILMPGMSGLEVLDAIRRLYSASDLPVVMATALGKSEDTVEALERGANDYVTKPFDFPVVMARVETQLGLERAAREIAALAQELEIRNAFIRRTFGRYVSEEVVSSLLENPYGLEIRGEKRRVSILMSDLRGFSILTEVLSPPQVVSLLNGFLGSMSEVIQRYGGSIDEFIGDAVLAFFGAHLPGEDDAERAVAAAVAMQLAMEQVNERNRKAGLPEIEMGIGIATGDVIVGNIGSEKRTKYSAIGSPVNLASRIESYTVGGEVLISDATLEDTRAIVRTSRTREIHPKGLGAPIKIHRVSAIGGRYDLQLNDREAELIDLREEIPVRFGVLEGKHVAEFSSLGAFCALSRGSARLRSREPVPELSELRLELVGFEGAFYAKVVTGSEGEAGEPSLLRFTTRSPELDQAIERALTEAR